MQHQPTSTTSPIYVADGYGLKIHVERGHLIVHDGLGRDRRTARFSRATSGLRRLVVIGHTGFVTLEALRWIRDVRATFVQIDRDGTLITVTAPERLHESKLRRAQVLAAESPVGKVAMIRLLREKLERQADVIEHRLSHLRRTMVRKHQTPIRVADAIREQIPKLTPDLSFTELRKLESIAGRYYWQTWARLPIAFDSSWRGDVPDHWQIAGPRTSKIDAKSARRALTPAHAILNYAYAMLETETIIAAHALGLDPSLGLMHTDQRYRTSLATDLMEPVRPTADEIALDLLESQELRRHDVYETREGTCRVGVRLIRELTEFLPLLRSVVAGHTERLAQLLLRTPAHPTPITRQRHRDSMGEATRVPESRTLMSRI